MFENRSGETPQDSGRKAGTITFNMLTIMREQDHKYQT